MAKYSFEFKLQIVQEYLSGYKSIAELCQKYSIPQERQVSRWISSYRVLGVDSLRRSRTNKNYTFEFKLHVVQLYLTTEISYQELANTVGLNNPSLIARWVGEFRVAGPDTLRPKLKGRKKMAKQQKIKPKAAVKPAYTENDYVKQLENELLMLQIENAFLKEMRRLRLEDEARQRERLESSTASEETSD